MNLQPQEQSVDEAAMRQSNRIITADKHFLTRATIKHPANDTYKNQLFQRLVAKEVSFINIDFSYSIFDTCYLRKCTFQDCIFIGCRFTASNLYESSFSGCKFDYAIFERTNVDAEIMDTSFPSGENLKLKFARTLRVNFQSLGDAASVNKAIQLELAATKEHLLKGWYSNESYYRKKYQGWKRFQMFLSWSKFKSLDFIWGNGESIERLFIFTLYILTFMTFIDVYFFGNLFFITSYFESYLRIIPLFMGITSTSVRYSEDYLAVIAVIRLMTFAFFTSILIKRFSRR